MRNITIAVIGAVSLFGLCGAVANSQQGDQAPAARAAAPLNMATDKTMFWTADDIQARWKDIETKKVINSRILNGPEDISVNVRIVLDGDSPATHGKTADLWIVQAGTATAVTDGTMVPADGATAAAGGDGRGKSITNPIERPVHAGDILYVPPGVPHYFKDIKGFRAIMVRFDPPLATSSQK